MAFRKTAAAAPPPSDSGSDSETATTASEEDGSDAEPLQQARGAPQHDDEDDEDDEDEDEEEEDSDEDEDEEDTDSDSDSDLRAQLSPSAGVRAPGHAPTPNDVSAEIVELALEVVDGDDVSPVVRLAFERAAPQARTAFSHSLFVHRSLRTLTPTPSRAAARAGGC